MLESSLIQVVTALENGIVFCLREKKAEYCYYSSSLSFSVCRREAVQRTYVRQTNCGFLLTRSEVTFTILVILSTEMVGKSRLGL